MIYYLPERIYEVLKNDDEVIEALLSIEEKFEKYNTFKDFMAGYSKLQGDINIRNNFISTNNLIRNKLADNKTLALQFDINDGVISLDGMKKLYFNGKEIDGVDLENKFFLISNICNQTEDHGEYELFIKRFIDLYDSTDTPVVNKLSKYIHLKYMYCRIYMMGVNQNTIDTNWESLFIDNAHMVYKYIEKLVNDKDITTNYYLEAFATAIRRINFNREGKYQFDTAWLHDVLTYVLMGLRNEEGSDMDFQYEKFSVGYLALLDEAATIYCLTNDRVEFNFVLNKIVDYINRALSDEKKLLRGLAFYDKVNHNMFAAIIRKYIKVLAGIKTSLKINGLSDEDREYILSDNLGELAAAIPNRIQETRTVKCADIIADAMIRKSLEID